MATATQVRCSNPAHGVKFHVPGSAAASECAAASGRARTAAAVPPPVTIAVGGAEPPVSFADVPKADRVEAMRDEIDDAIESMSDPEAWQRFLEASVKLHRYSFRNRLLIAMQRPDATATAGFNDWKSKHGRKVKPGEKAIWVFAPITYRKTETDADGKETEKSSVRGVRAVPTFDISQTEPIEGDSRGTALEHRGIAVTPLEGEAPDGMTEDLTRAAESFGFTVEYQEELPRRSAGFTDFASKRIVIRSTDSHRERANTLAHELGHVACGHEDQTADYHTGAGGLRPDMEVEAESVAYVIARSYGVAEAGQANFGYIDGWARGDKDRIKRTAEKVVKATKSVLGVIEQRGSSVAA